MDNIKKSLVLSPVHYAVLDNDEEKLKDLIAEKADINVVCENEWNTPLMEACKKGYIGMIMELLKANAIVSQPDKIGKTADQYLKEIKDLNKSRLKDENMLDIFESCIKKLEKRKIKEQLEKNDVIQEEKLNKKTLKQELDDQKRRFKKQKKIELKEQMKRMTYGFKKII